MTAIAAVAHKGDVWMGGDSCGSDGWRSAVRADEKVFLVGPMVMGFTSSFRMGQLLRYSLTVPEQPAGSTDAQFMSTAFVDAVRKCLKDGGFARKENETETGGDFLVGYRGVIYHVQSDYSVSVTLDQEGAVGSGYLVCLGALFANRGRPPKERIRQVLAAAAHHAVGVRPPFTILRLPAERRRPA